MAKKSYIFTISKYYNDEEIERVSPIIENYVALFADENGVATLKLKDDVTVIIKREEGLVLHMVLDNADRFTALPKTLARPKDFLNKFITAMAEAVDAKAQEQGIAAAKAKVEKKAEDDLFSYIGGEAAPAATPTADAPATEDGGVKVTVKVNGKEITDPAEKEKVQAEVDAKIDAMRERATKMFEDTFTSVFKSLVTDNDWLKKYLG